MSGEPGVAWRRQKYFHGWAIFIRSSADNLFYPKTFQDGGVMVYPTRAAVTEWVTELRSYYGKRNVCIVKVGAIS